MIIEGKLSKIIVLLALVVSVTTIIALINSEEVLGVTLDAEPTIDGMTYDEHMKNCMQQNSANNESFCHATWEFMYAVSGYDDTEADLWSIIGFITSSALFQIVGAPALVNAFLGIVAVVIYSVLAIIIVAFARELIGLT